MGVPFRKAARCGCILFFLSLSIEGIHAQVRLFLQRPLVDSFPCIRIPLRVEDNASTVRELDAGMFTVRENAVAVTPVSVSCTADSMVRTVHFMFLLDVSLSMGYVEGTTEYDEDSVKWRRAREVFIESFHRLRPMDYGAFISFAAGSKLGQGFTRDIRLLEDAIAGLGLRSGTAIYDAIVHALSLCKIDTGKTVIILLTDGADQSSILSLDDAIQAARAFGVPVYIIGLDVRDERVTEMELLARRTGGEYVPAPTSDVLSEIFERIMRSIVQNDCILSYHTPDTCRGGTTRLVEVRVDLGTLSDSGAVDYSVEDFRSRIRLIAAIPDTVVDETVVSVPIIAEGEIRAGEAANFDLLARHDPSHCSFLDVLASGTVFEGATIDAREETPGLVRVSCVSAVPNRGVTYHHPDTILVLRYAVPYHAGNTATALTVSPVSWRQFCDVLSEGSETAFIVKGCPAYLRLGIDTTLVCSTKHHLEIPILLHDPVDLLQDFRFSFSCDYDTGAVRFEGYSTAGTVSAAVPVTVDEPVAGRLTVSTGWGRPARASGTLITMVYSPTQWARSMRVPIVVGNIHIEQSCVPTVEFSGDHVFLDGWCEPLLARRNAVGIESISPNPVDASSGNILRIEFFIPRTTHARIDLATVEGKVITLIAEGLFDEGMHTVALPADNLPAGAYLCRLDGEGSSATMRVVVLK
ncbi:MAG: VWA domain-containing protein [Bacteroidota bacterium]|nr:VWA domain-containing protein [Bacteroidota bacterium]